MCLLVTVIGIDRQCDIPIVGTIASIVPIYQNLLVEEIGINSQIHTPILRRINTLLYQFLWTSWSKQYVLIAKVAYLSKGSISIDT